MAVRTSRPVRSLFSLRLGPLVVGGYPRVQPDGKWAILLLVNVYRRETKEIVSRFLSGQLTLDQCSAALYEEFSGALPDIGPNDLPDLQAITNSNDETIRLEIKRRRSSAPALG